MDKTLIDGQLSVDLVMDWWSSEEELSLSDRERQIELLR